VNVADVATGEYRYALFVAAALSLLALALARNPHAARAGACVRKGSRR
jgi:hypothetical protein